MLSSPSLPRSNTLIINLQSSSSFSTQNPYPEGSFTHTDKALFGGVPTSVKVKYPERNQIKNVRVHRPSLLSGMVILPKSESSDLVGIVIKEKKMPKKKKLKKKEIKKKRKEKRAKTRENLYIRRKTKP